MLFRSLELKLGYLFAGRQIVHLAGLKRIDERAIDWMTGGAGVVTVNALLDRVGLVPSEVLPSLQKYGLPLEGKIGWERLAQVKDFFKDPSVQTSVLKVAAQRRAEVRAYFMDCGLIDGDPCAVVDIGWRGSVLRSIFDIIGAESAAKHQFLYFGLYGRPADAPEARMIPFCFDASGPQPVGSASRVPSLMAVMEIFCQADHPQVLHVAKQGNAFVPILRQAPADTPATWWDIKYFQDCMEAFADAVAIDVAPNPDADLRLLCENLLQCLMSHPTRDEARVLGSIQYVDDQSGTTSQPFAVPFRLVDARAALRSGHPPQKTLTWWEQGAWELTSGPVRRVLDMACWLGRRRGVRPQG